MWGGAWQGRRSPRLRRHHQLLRGSGRLTAAEMGAWALLLPLLMATAQAQGTCGAGAGGLGGRRAGRRREGTDPSSPTFQSAL